MIMNLMTHEISFADKVPPIMGEVCDSCKDGADHGKCANCGQSLVLSYQGQFDNGEHVCSSDCANPKCRNGQYE